MRKLFDVALQIFEKALELALHRVHLLAHVEDDFDARKIDAEIACQREDYFEPFKIRISVKPRVALRTCRLEQTFTLIQTQRLRVQLELLRDCADCVGPGSLFLHRTVLCTWFFVLCSPP